MGNVANITAHQFPRQMERADRVRVCFHYDTTAMVGGAIVRDDAEAPYVLIIRLDDGRYVLGTECQWAPGEQHEA